MRRAPADARPGASKGYRAATSEPVISESAGPLQRTRKTPPHHPKLAARHLQVSPDLLKLVLNKANDFYLAGNLADAASAADFVRQAAPDCARAPAQCNPLAEQVRLVGVRA